jgi:antitoxin VapB
MPYLLGVIMDTAKVFMSGRSQAVRLPKEYRFDTDEVIIRRTPEGLLLIPKPAKNLGEELMEMFARIDAQYPDEEGDIDDFVRPDQGEFERPGDLFADFEDEPQAEAEAAAVHEATAVYRDLASLAPQAPVRKAAAKRGAPGRSKPRQP